jgi:membrane associated rhomboid family serine protease
VLTCPQCKIDLVKTKGSPGVFWWCPSCDGRSATVSLLRQSIPRQVVNRLWQSAKSGTYLRNRNCPSCSKPMAEVPAGAAGRTEYIDVCTVCQFIWFDPSEYAALSVLPSQPSDEKTLPQATRERVALLELDRITEEARGSEWGEGTPDEWWHWIPGVLGMPVEHDIQSTSRVPLVTWSLVLLVSLVSIVAFLDLDSAVDSLGLVPAQLGRYGGLTLLTSFCLHGGILHLLGNMYFLFVFGDNVEEWLGRWRFLLLVICSALAGDILHVMAQPDSMEPCIGASGGISGVIAYYALKFPRARLGILFRVSILFRWIRMPAYGMFIIWMGLQSFGVWSQLAGFSNVSSLAHLGGAATGCLFWFFTRTPASKPASG